MRASAAALDIAAESTARARASLRYLCVCRRPCGHFSCPGTGAAAGPRADSNKDEVGVPADLLAGMDDADAADVAAGAFALPSAPAAAAGSASGADDDREDKDEL